MKFDNSNNVCQWNNMNTIQYKIYKHLISEIVDGDLMVNSRLTPEIQLGEQFNTNRMNAHLAIKQLERRGIVRRNRQEGTLVARPVTPALARQLRGEAVKRICAIRSRNSFEYLHWNKEFTDGLENTLKKDGFTLESVFMNDVNTRDDLKKELKRLTDDGVSAFILSVRHEADRFMLDNFDILFQYHRHIFMYQSGALDWAHWPFHTVTVNLFGEGSIAAEYLIGKGYDRIAYCPQQIVVHEFWSLERFKGLQLGMRRMTSGKCSPEEWIGIETVYDKFMENGKKHALVAANDEHAAKLIDYFGGKGLQAGIDFKIIGFDDSEKFRQYQITTVAPAHMEVGRQLANLIIHNIDIEAKGNTTCYLKIDSELIPRETA